MVRSYIFPALACAVASFLSAPVSASPRQLYGINYNTRNGPDWAPREQKCKTPEQIADDLTVISGVTKRVRIYSLTDCNQGELVLKAAAKVPDMQVELGLWVSGDAAVFQAEKARLLELITHSGLITKERVTAIHVGSEAVYRKEVTSAQIIEYMKEVKTIATGQALQIPITIADIGDVYIAHPELVDAVDFVSANGFPFWEQKPVMGAAAYFQERMKPLMEMAANQSKAFVISETGWASDGVNVNASIASPGNAKQYLKEFLDLATNWKYYYFEAFDESWKVALDKENTVEGYFGIFHANRTLKSDFAALGFMAPVMPPFGGHFNDATTTGNNGASTTGNNGATTSGNNGATTAGNNGATTSGNNGATTTGNKETTTTGNNGATTSGNNGGATTGNNGAAATGNNGAATTGNNGGATTGNNGGTTKAYPHPDCPV